MQIIRVFVSFSTYLFEENLDQEDVGNLKGHIIVYTLGERVQSNYQSHQGN